MVIRKSIALFVVLIAVSSLLVAQSKKWKAILAEADTLYEHEEYSTAAIRYTKILDANPPKNGRFDDRYLYGVVYKRAVSYYSIREFDKALADLAIFEPQHPRSPQPKILKAFIYRELDDRDKQLENLTAAMALQPPNPDFLKWRGLIYLQKDKIPEARADLQEALQFGEDAELATYLGLCYHHEGKLDSAYQHFNRAIELNPFYIGVYLYAGSAALQDGDHERAMVYLDLGLRLDPKNPDALYYKGVALMELKRTDEACQYFNRAFYAGSDDAADYLEEYCFNVGR